MQPYEKEIIKKLAAEIAHKAAKMKKHETAENRQIEAEIELLKKEREKKNC